MASAPAGAPTGSGSGMSVTTCRTHNNFLSETSRCVLYQTALAVPHRCGVLAVSLTAVLCPSKQQQGAQTRWHSDGAAAVAALQQRGHSSGAEDSPRRTSGTSWPRWQRSPGHTGPPVWHTENYSGSRDPRWQQAPYVSATGEHSRCIGRHHSGCLVI